MLESLKFVQGAIARKDLVPELTHFRIKKGFIKGYNGKIALCGPIAMDLDVTPKAAPFVKAIQTCEGTIQLNLTANGSLSVRSGSFRAKVECLSDSGFPDIQPEGERYDFDFDLVEVLRKLLPLVAQDASRPWACGILLKGHSAFATNNIVLVEHWLPDSFPVVVNIPASAIQEIVRIGEEPIYLQATDKSVTFHYEGDRWLKCQLLDLGWPDLEPLLCAPCKPEELPADLFSRLETLLPFAGDGGHVHFLGECASTTANAEDGAAQYIEGCPQVGAYSLKQLLLLAPIAQRIDWTLHPKPCIFYGDSLRGAIIGIRQL